MTQTVHMVKVEDHEGNGRCGACQREGLRWIVTMSDGSQIGTECAKRAMGISIAPKKYQWTANFTPVAEYVEYGQTLVLWQHKNGTATAETTNGYLTATGGRREVWEKRGWL